MCVVDRAATRRSMAGSGRTAEKVGKLRCTDSCPERRSLFVRGRDVCRIADLFGFHPIPGALQYDAVARSASRWRGGPFHANCGRGRPRRLGAAVAGRFAPPPASGRHRSTHALHVRSFAVDWRAGKTVRPRRKRNWGRRRLPHDPSPYFPYTTIFLCLSRKISVLAFAAMLGALCSSIRPVRPAARP